MGAAFSVYPNGRACISIVVQLAIGEVATSEATGENANSFPLACPLEGLASLKRWMMDLSIAITFTYRS